MTQAVSFDLTVCSRCDKYMPPHSTKPSDRAMCDTCRLFYCAACVETDSTGRVHCKTCVEKSPLTGDLLLLTILEVGPPATIRR